jgi:hypothetical protein
MKRIMFYDVCPAQDGIRDNAFHGLDQSWRRVNRGEAILVGRLAPAEGAAETVLEKPTVAGRLWLGKLPAAGETRPPLAGTLTQKTYVRIFLPVRQAPKSRGAL